MGERPGIYIKLEVGVFWPRHMNKRRSTSFTFGAIRDDRQASDPVAANSVNARSRTLTGGRHSTEREQSCLRQVYNYTTQKDFHLDQTDLFRHRVTSSAGETAARPTIHSVEQPTFARSCYVAPHPMCSQQPLRPTRTDDSPRRSRSMSHNRRGSETSLATQERPWDADPEPLGFTALPLRPVPRDRGLYVHEPLPVGPNQFRLVENSMPWSGAPDSADYSAVEACRRAQVEAYYHPDIISLFSCPQQSPEDHERGQAVEMQSLATALLTVDNGFEDQWWFQGPRLTTIAGDLIAPTPLREIYDYISPGMRDCASSPSACLLQVSTPSSTIVDLVSPLDDLSHQGSQYSHATM